MMFALLSGLAIGLGLWLGGSSLAPEQRSLIEAAARLNRPAEQRETVTGVVSRAGRFGATFVGRPIGAAGTASADLAIAGRSAEVHLGLQMAGALCGLFGGSLVGGAMWLAGIAVVTAFPLWVSLLGAGLGWSIPTIELHRVVARRRSEFRHCLGSYIDLVVLLLTADEGVTGALEQAASAGGSWPFVELRRALGESRLTAVTPWAALRSLGERYGVDDLVELSSAAHLAGSEGASVRASLVAKARTLRDRALAHEEAASEQSSTRMVFPLLLLVCAFILFVGYPAVMEVLNS